MRLNSQLDDAIMKILVMGGEYGPLNMSSDSNELVAPRETPLELFVQILRRCYPVLQADKSCYILGKYSIYKNIRI